MQLYGHLASTMASRTKVYEIKYSYSIQRRETKRRLTSCAVISSRSLAATQSTTSFLWHATEACKRACRQNENPSFYKLKVWFKMHNYIWFNQRQERSSYLQHGKVRISKASVLSNHSNPDLKETTIENE